MNRFSAGSEYGHRPGPPVNEDHSIVVTVIADNGIAIVGEKLWGGGQLIAANWSGQIAEAGSKVVFRRIPETGGYNFACLEVSHVIPVILVKQLWYYTIATGIWHEITSSGDAPEHRYGALCWLQNTLQLYVCGGISATTGQVLSDFWIGQIDQTTKLTVTWTKQDDLPFGASCYGGAYTDYATYAWVMRGLNGSQAQTTDFYQYTMGTGLWTQLADHPLGINRTHAASGTWWSAATPGGYINGLLWSDTARLTGSYAWTGSYYRSGEEYVYKLGGYDTWYGEIPLHPSHLGHTPVANSEAAQTDGISTLGGDTTDNLFYHLLCMPYTKGYWKRANCPYSIKNAAISNWCYTYKDIYAFGGQINGSSSNLLQLYTASGNNWSEPTVNSDSPEPRHSHFLGRNRYDYPRNYDLVLYGGRS